MAKRKLNWKGFAMVFAFSPLVLIVSWIFYLMGAFYWHLDEYSSFVFKGDVIGAKKKLDQLDYFYNWSGRLKLDFITNRFLFKEADYYKNAYYYLIGRYELVEQDLANDDNFWAYYLRGNSSWRRAQEMYRFAITRNESERAGIMKSLKMTLEGTKQYYKKAVEIDSEKRWSPKWNYDLVVIVRKGLEKNASSFEKAMACKALGPKPKKIKLKLGIGGSGKGSGNNKKGGKPSSSPGKKPEIRG